MSTHPVKHRNVTARPLAVALLAVVLDACALDPTYPDAPPPPGSTAVSIIGTPFLIAFKIPACAATLAIGAPLAAATELGDPDRSHPWGVRYEIDHAVTANCGPPWILPPYP